MSLFGGQAQQPPIPINRTEIYYHSRQSVKDVATNLIFTANAQPKIQCHECKRKGHYSSQCFSKTVNEITEQMEAEDLDVSYLSTIGTDNDSSWNATIQINGQSVVFKLESGAEVTAITESTLTKLGNVQLSPAAKSLCGPDRKPLKIMGTLITELAYIRVSVDIMSML